MAGAAILGSVSLSSGSDDAGGEDESYGGVDFSKQFGTIVLASGVLVAISSIYGFSETARCRAIIERARPVTASGR